MITAITVNMRSMRFIMPTTWQFPFHIEWWASNADFEEKADL
jgi:hypothetical protein